MDISHVSSPSSSMSLRPDYHVFLSFRGPDTRRNFADFLYTSLKDVGIRVFKDDKDLEVGKAINPQLIQAIEQSKISMPIISKKYASSKSCLMELDEMVKCMENKNHIIIPIFYYVKPSDVRDCAGPFQEASNKHKKRGRDDSILNPRMPAFCQIGELTGYHLQNKKNEKPLGEVIKQIVHEVEKKLKTRDLVVPKQLVGVDPRAQDIMAKLKVVYRNGQAEIGEPREMVLGIYGIPGVGKTVLAKYVYNQLHHLFDACSFLENIQEESRDHGILSVQNRLISDLHKGNAQRFDLYDHALKHIQERFRHMKVLLLLDNVKDHEQLRTLVGDLGWLHPESRVILTSRSCDVLQKVDGAENYVLGSMKKDKALTLFCKHAFKSDSPPEDFERLATDIVAATDRLPLALEKIGGFLFEKAKRRGRKN
ncbi:disease resistance protein RPV1-like isoform X1 [Eucalyptus grandis]|uniref:disease resistance protein RPV1-like isoform X1 n=1 Tax=Eucalyptus grandis TaxID=71139 RepID=UPI00192ECEC6|nr:disease resistance protein RPV1-like isoform X1 [Eucalyptus grandis]